MWNVLAKPQKQRQPSCPHLASLLVAVTLISSPEELSSSSDSSDCRSSTMERRGPGGQKARKSHQNGKSKCLFKCQAKLCHMACVCSVLSWRYLVLLYLCDALDHNWTVQLMASNSKEGMCRSTLMCHKLSPSHFTTKPFHCSGAWPNISQQEITHQRPFLHCGIFSKTHQNKNFDSSKITNKLCVNFKACGYFCMLRDSFCWTRYSQGSQNLGSTTQLTYSNRPPHQMLGCKRFGKLSSQHPAAGRL